MWSSARLPVVSVVVGCFLALTASAAQRTFVSAAVGSDANSCLRLSPCRNFAPAITATDPGGEVIVLDSGGYGVVTITKGISIIAPQGVFAGVAGFTGTAIDVSVASPATVTLRGLSINSQGGTTGVAVSSDAIVNMDNLVVSGFSGNGIEVTGGARVTVHDTTVRGSGASGIYLGPTAPSGDAMVLIDGARLENNTYGFAADSGVSVTIRNAVATNSFPFGFWFRNAGAKTPLRASVENTIAQDGHAFGLSYGFLAENGARVTLRNSAALRNDVGFNPSDASGVTLMTVDGCLASENSQGFIAGSAFLAGGGTALLDVSNSTATNNGANGIVAVTHGTVRAFGNTVTHNGTGINGGAGTFYSFGQNAVHGNGTDKVDTIIDVPTM